MRRITLLPPASYARTAWLACAAALAMVLAACGGGGGGSSAGSESGSSGDGELTAITVYRSPASGFEALYLGQEAGVFEKHGLEVTVETGGAAAEQIPLLLNGQAQFAMTDPSSVISAAANGVPVSITYPLQEDEADVVPSSVWVRADSDIQTIADLEGRSVGMGGLGGLPNLFVEVAVDAAELEQGSVAYVDLPIPSVTEALKDGTVDAAFLFGVFHHTAEDEGLRLLENVTHTYMPGVPQIVWAASNSFIESEPEVVETFGAALAEAYELANADVEGRRAVLGEYTDSPQEYLQEVVLPTYATMLPLEQLQTVSEQMARFGYIEGDPPSTDEFLADLAPTR